MPVIERTERLFVGAARNLGIAATTAPYVGFLASDCTAARGWSHHRIKAHHKGQATVASAVVPSHRRSCIASASHIALFRRRLPGVDPKQAALYGASYERALFATYGLFREDIRVGEDTEFHARLPAGKKPVWNGRVRAVHASPTRLVDLLRDQYGRGARMSDSAPDYTRPSHPIRPALVSHSGEDRGASIAELGQPTGHPLRAARLVAPPNGRRRLCCGWRRRALEAKQKNEVLECSRPTSSHGGDG